MGSWQRFNPVARQRLLEFVVPLRRTGWYTLQTIHSMQGLMANQRECVGFDVGGHVFLARSWHQAIMALPSMQAYSIQRRTLRQAFGGHDFFGEKITFSPGQAFHPTDRQTISDSHINDLYDICMSFETAREAVLFRIAVQGVVEPA